MFKFGLLLLLVQENAFAEQRLPRYSTASLLSALQQAPQLRQDSLCAYHSPVQGLLSSGFRRFSNSTGATCAWDPDRRECSLSLSSIKHLLEKSQSEFAKILVQHLTCAEKMNVKDCFEVGSCMWSAELGRCHYQDLLSGHEESPCAKAAPRLFGYLKALADCPKECYAEGCESKSGCIWYSSYGYCGTDGDFFLFGIKNFTGKFEQMEDSVEATLLSEYKALTSADNFTWQSLLDYKTSVECPSDVEQLVCDYIVASASIVIPRRLYCSGKYASTASECEADALCMWNAQFGECGPDKYLAMLAADDSLYKVLIDSLPGVGDKRLAEVVISCSDLETKRKCKGNCIWNAVSRFCDPRKDYMAAILTEAGGNSTDALCTYIDIVGSSQCFTPFFQYKCWKSELCRWNLNSQCEPKEEFYLSAAANRDSRLNRRYQRFKKYCALHTTEKTCMEPSKVY